MEGPFQAFPIEADFKKYLKKREFSNLLRTFGPIRDIGKADFYSNDYLGLCLNGAILPDLQRDIEAGISLGSSGSRLVSGQNEILEDLESDCQAFFKSEAVVFFPNGYLANLALLSTVANRHDTILYDEQCHVSLKDGIRLSLAEKFSFKHNDVNSLEQKLSISKGRKFIVIESIYSMDGDLTPLTEIVELAQKYEGHIIIDEAHSTGTVGERGEGLSLSLGLESRIWARIYTFGKALGASGGLLAISGITKNYLINKSHPLIYSTASMPMQALICKHQLSFLKNNPDLVGLLQSKIYFWNKLIFRTNNKVSKNDLSPVQYYKVQGNKEALQMAKKLQDSDIQIKAMLSPTVKEGAERIRISLHGYNTENQMMLLKGFIEEFENIFTKTF